MFFRNFSTASASPIVVLLSVNIELFLFNCLVDNEQCAQFHRTSVNRVLIQDVKFLIAIFCSCDACEIMFGIRLADCLFYMNYVTVVYKQ